ncbi:MAG: lycopene cyclase family protein [Bacteroidota bacterium]
MVEAKRYQYAVIGGGAAGLSLVYNLIKEDVLNAEHRLVLVDPEIKKGHDHTWCFWEKGNGPFESIVQHTWSHLNLHSHHEDLALPLNKYRYKTIFSNDFYDYVNRIIGDNPYVDRLVTVAEQIEVGESEISFTADGQPYRAAWGFSSLFNDVDLRGPKHISQVGNRQKLVDKYQLKAPYLDQHFRGWFIQTHEDIFDPDWATLMDFRTDQPKGETRFFYVLPISPNRALVEMAIFSNEVWPISRFDQVIEEYIHKYWTPKGSYEVYHTEDGLIPMTTHSFPQRQGRLLFIGLRGNQGRPSTGYAFYNMQGRLSELAKRIKENPEKLEMPRPWPRRHLLYDATLLRILEREIMPGAQVFMDLFRQNPTDRLLAFLNGETNFGAELKLMSSTRIRTFAPGFVRELLAY